MTRRQIIARPAIRPSAHRWATAAVEMAPISAPAEIKSGPNFITEFPCATSTLPTLPKANRLQAIAEIGHLAGVSTNRPGQ